MAHFEAELDTTLNLVLLSCMAIEFRTDSLSKIGGGVT
jgi:hypothetical protein